MDDAISQNEKDVVHLSVDLGLHVLEDSGKDPAEMGGTAQSRILDRIFVSLEHSCEALHRWVSLASQIEAVVDLGCPSEPRDAAKAKESKLILEGVGLQNGANRRDGHLIVIKLTICVLPVQGLREVDLSVRLSKVNGDRHVDEPATSEVFYEGWLLHILDVIECQGTSHAALGVTDF